MFSLCMQKITNESYDTLFVRELAKRLQQKTGIDVKEFADCKLISDKMNLNGFHVSAHTIARFLGILKANHRPYTSTLNLFCHYLEFETYADFCRTIQNELDTALYSPIDSFQTGPFSLVTLEIALANEDWKSVQHLLTSFEKTSPLKNELVMLLGNIVRKHPKQKELLNALIEIENGRWLFYESYVDEDDPNNYYSDALKTFYQSNLTESNNQIFLHCFLISKAIYEKKPVDEKMLSSILFNENIPLKNLHFHELSRYFEIQILLDFRTKKLKDKLTFHLERIIEHCQRFNHYDTCWIVARCIKALAFSGQLKRAFQYGLFREMVLNLYHEMDNKIESIAELIIQFTVHSFQKKIVKNATIFPPIRISAAHDNETNSRLVIEASTSLLYADGEIKSMLEKNVYSFAKKTGHSWVFELLK